MCGKSQVRLSGFSARPTLAQSRRTIGQLPSFFFSKFTYHNSSSALARLSICPPLSLPRVCVCSIFSVETHASSFWLAGRVFDYLSSVRTCVVCLHCQHGTSNPPSDVARLLPGQQHTHDRASLHITFELLCPVLFRFSFISGRGVKK